MWAKGDAFIFKCGYGVCTYSYTPFRGHDPLRSRKERIEHFTPCTAGDVMGGNSHTCIVVMLNDFADQAAGWLDHLPTYKMWSIIANGTMSVFSNNVETIPDLVERGIIKKI